MKHFYSSKPALVADSDRGNSLSGAVGDRRSSRSGRSSGAPGALDPESRPDFAKRVKGVLETPKDPAKWPAYIFYFKPIIVLLNVVPYGIFLVLFARLLDRLALGDWTWFFCLIAAAFGTYLLPFTQTLNNHTVAAWSVFFAVYSFVRIWDERKTMRAGGSLRPGSSRRSPPPMTCPRWLFCPCSSACWSFAIPERRCFTSFLRRSIPIAAFLAAQYAVFGELKLAYESFGSDEYLYEGSLWKTPLDLDAFNDHPEPYAVYLFHMTLGIMVFFP